MSDARTPSYRDVAPRPGELVTDDEAMETKVWADQTSGEYGDDYADVDFSIAVFKRTEAILILASTQKSADLRKAEAMAHPDWLEAAKGVARAQARWKTMEKRMEFAKLKVEVWRTVRANERQREAFAFENEKLTRQGRNSY